MGDLERLGAHRDARRAFVWRVFSLATVFILVATAQWIVGLLTDPLRDVLIEHFYISGIVLLFGLVPFNIFVHCERARMCVPINWILIVLIVECFTWGLSYIVLEVYSLDNFGYSFLVVILFMILLGFIASSMSLDLTLHVLLFFIGAIIFFVAALLFILLYAVAGIIYAVYFFLIVLVIFGPMALIYNFQLVLGGRSEEMKISEFLLAALVFFLFFVVLFVVVFYLVSIILNHA